MKDERVNETLVSYLEFSSSVPGRIFIIISYLMGTMKTIVRSAPPMGRFQLVMTKIAIHENNNTVLTLSFILSG